MSIGRERRGSEIRERKDEKTGRAIWQVTHSHLESKHAYYDICPWDPSGKYLVFSSARPSDVATSYRDGYSTLHGMVCVADTESWEIETVARDAFYIAHVGAFPLWHPLKRRIFFRRSPDEIGMVDLDQDVELVIEGGLRQLSPDGMTFVFTTNELDQQDPPGAVSYTHLTLPTN